MEFENRSGLNDSMHQMPSSDLQQFSVKRRLGNRVLGGREQFQQHTPMSLNHRIEDSFYQPTRFQGQINDFSPMSESNNRLSHVIGQPE